MLEKNYCAINTVVFRVVVAIEGVAVGMELVDTAEFISLSKASFKPITVLQECT